MMPGLTTHCDVAAGGVYPVPGTDGIDGIPRLNVELVLDPLLLSQTSAEHGGLNGEPVVFRALS